MADVGENQAADIRSTADQRSRSARTLFLIAVRWAGEGFSELVAAAGNFHCTGHDVDQHPLSCADALSGPRCRPRARPKLRRARGNCPRCCRPGELDESRTVRNAQPNQASR